MGNLQTGGVGFTGNPDGFEPFGQTGGEVHALIVACGYGRSDSVRLTSIRDGDLLSRICSVGGATDVVVMRDDLDPSDALFPTSQHVRDMLASVGSRCGPRDVFLLYYSGHGARVEDVSGDELDGFDEAMVLPGPNGELSEDHYLLDDDLALALDEHIPKDTGIFVLADCCHSATITDIDTFGFKHRICAISACQDSEKSVDTGSHGVLTLAIKNALTELSVKRGKMEYSIQSVYNKAVKHARRITKRQTLAMHCANMDPKLCAWPLPQPWWRHIPRVI